MQALDDAEVLLRPILSHNEEAPGLGEFGVLADLEVLKVTQLGLALLVEGQELTDKVGIVTSQLLTVLLEVEDGAGLALNLVDVGIVGSSDFIGGLGTLGCAALTRFLGLAG